MALLPIFLALSVTHEIGIPHQHSATLCVMRRRVRKRWVRQRRRVGCRGQGLLPVLARVAPQGRAWKVRRDRRLRRVEVDDHRPHRKAGEVHHESLLGLRGCLCGLLSRAMKENSAEWTMLQAGPVVSNESKKTPEKHGDATK